ncbi:MAG: hypothetical protein JRH08_00545 [Deltaproteobacteria bacterium]|nr:hypothetical protein [Deltaproteobacteria bacterium]MBW1929438.1 hypothetical protein [Deltaproteobacteria bacterium]MBW2023903.1 hypothetical protein [Deltaproteobacteria bacterium]MBW2124192.1 hypothetical protein [Deltaproteobacteria bacterium]RLB18459.1 MAG: hypothetical protein DRG63_02350 [Deltaproteobacteria bacterium]
MTEITPEKELEGLVSKGCFLRAAEMAESTGLDEDVLWHYRHKALWQMAAVNRNMPGTKKLAAAYGLNKAELKDLLENLLKTHNSENDKRDLEPCYDQHTGDYLTFEQWMAQLFKRWDKLTVQ